MSYRDDLGAAVARADGLARELDEVTRRAVADRARIRELDGTLEAARRELEELRRSLPPEAPEPESRRRGIDRRIVLAMTAGVALVAIGVGAAMWLVNKRVDTRQPEVVEDHTMSWVPAHSQAQPPSAPGADESLDREAVQAAIQENRDEVKKCYACSFKVPRTAKVKFMIAPGLWCRAATCW